MVKTKLHFNCTLTVSTSIILIFTINKSRTIDDMNKVFVHLMTYIHTQHVLFLFGILFQNCLKIDVSHLKSKPEMTLIRVNSIMKNGIR